MRLRFTEDGQLVRVTQPRRRHKLRKDAGRSRITLDERVARLESALRKLRLPLSVRF
jgi:hypothetical protein